MSRLEADSPLVWHRNLVLIFSRSADPALGRWPQLLPASVPELKTLARKIDDSEDLVCVFRKTHFWVVPRAFLNLCCEVPGMIDVRYVQQEVFSTLCLFVFTPEFWSHGKSRKSVCQVFLIFFKRPFFKEGQKKGPKEEVGAAHIMHVEEHQAVSAEKQLWHYPKFQQLLDSSKQEILFGRLWKCSKDLWENLKAVALCEVPLCLCKIFCLPKFGTAQTGRLLGRRGPLKK